MEHNFPKWFYHKEICPDGKIIKDEEQFSALSEGWKETPADFDKESDETTKEPTGDQGSKDPDIEKVDFLKMTVKELKEILISKGVPEADLKKLNKDQLIVKLGAM